MNTLKQHISKSLGIYENFYGDFHNESEQEIIGWITENYTIGRSKLQFEQTNEARRIDCDARLK